MSASKLSKGDRRTLLLLLIALLLFSGYHFLRPTQGAQEQLAAQTPPDTIYLPAPSDTIEPKGTPTTPDTLPIRTERYPGPPERPSYPKKLKPGAVVDINSADTLLLQRIPGIGPSFARRIHKYRELLGGYYCVEQIQEVYGMDRERYDQISPYMEVKTSVRPINLSHDTIPYHPYLQWAHRNTLTRLQEQGDTITWTRLRQSGHFSRDDSLRLSPYLQLPH